MVLQIVLEVGLVPEHWRTGGRASTIGQRDTVHFQDFATGAS